MNGVLDRPFYFIVVLWGARFRDYFLDYCVPSLLGPGNLPALTTRQPSKILIATTSADWAALEASPIFAVLQRYVVPTLIEIPPCPPERSSYDHMGLGHKLACEMAYRDAAYTTLLTPDCMLSDGTVARLQQLALSGCDLVIVPAVRFGEEPFFAQLKNLKLLPEIRGSQSGAPLVISSRQMVYAGVNALHSEMFAYEWDAPGFLLVLPTAWWPVPGENGILVHSLTWAPMLLDYGALADHDTSTFDRWTFDGDYLFNNSKKLKNIHVVQDSDEMFLLSWGPMGIPPVAKHYFPLIGKLAAKVQFGANYKSAFFDRFKRDMFFTPVRWHGEPLSDKWPDIERHAMRELLRYTTPPGQSLFFEADGFGEKLRRIGARALTTLFVVLRPVFILIYHRKAVWRRLRQLARADKESLRQLLWYVRLFGFNKS
jgi:hypothetical protein